MSMKNKDCLHVVVGVVVLLAIPFLAMQFTDEVMWNLSDFVVAGSLLFGVGLVYKLFVKKMKNTAYRIIAGVVILAVLFLVFAELAVGVFGTPWAGS